MFYNSYLNPHTIRESCRDYITYLEKENLVYDEIPKLYKSILNSGDGDYMEAFKLLMAGVGSHMSSLRRANDYDIEDANTFINIVGEEIYDGSVIFSGKQRALLDINNYGSKASSCYSNAYQATDPDMISYWRGQGSYYDGLVNDARGVYNLYEQKEKRYDEINELSKPLFVRGAELRDVIINDNPLSSMEYVGIDYSTIEEMINGSRDSDSGHSGNGYPNNPLVPPPGSINGEQGHDLFLGPKSSYTDNMQEFVLKYPELADMVNLQGHIIATTNEINNCTDIESKPKLIKNLKNLIYEQRKNFSENLYEYNEKGNIIGNHLKDWEKNNKKDLIDFFKSIYNSINYLNRPNDLTNDYMKANVNEMIGKLSEMKESLKDSIMRDKVEKLINSLGTQFNDSIYVTAPVEGIETIKLKDFESIVGSAIIVKEVVVDKITDEIPRETMEIVLHEILNGKASRSPIKVVSYTGITINVSFLSIVGGTFSIGIYADAKDNILIAPSFGGGMNVGPEPTTGGVFGINGGLTVGGFLTDDVNNLGSQTVSVGASGGAPIYGVPVYGGIDVIGTSNVKNDATPNNVLDNELINGDTIVGGSMTLGVGTPGADAHFAVSYSPTIDTFNIVDIVLDSIY